jgi:hypothetical protein
MDYQISPVSLPDFPLARSSRFPHFIKRLFTLAD